ncbi:MAG TPA: DMT family protein [Chitinophagaceae bacterium]|nr:DMT family protein [Chitinophagaceae bacterium]
MKGLTTIVLLTMSNVFMTLAWYGHLKFKEWKPIQQWGMLGIILISWGIAFFEYMLQVPANRIGYSKFGGPFTLVQLKVIQEALAITVFIILTLLLFRDERLAWNHIAAFALIILAVYLVFK